MGVKFSKKLSTLVSFSFTDLSLCLSYPLLLAKKTTLNVTLYELDEAFGAFDFMGARGSLLDDE